MDDESIKRTRTALQSILFNIHAARRFVAPLTVEAFVADLQPLYATTRCCEIISEASRKLPDELKGRHHEIAWPKIAAAGNVYRHEYEYVSARVIWATVHETFDALEAAVRTELAALPPADE